MWDSLADMLKIVRLREVGGDDEQEIREIMQHLFTNMLKAVHSKRDGQLAKTRMDSVFSKLVDQIPLIDTE